MGHGRAYRLTAIDMLRGLAIVFMAIDHVGDYFLFGASATRPPTPTWPPHFSRPVGSPTSARRCSCCWPAPVPASWRDGRAAANWPRSSSPAGLAPPVEIFVIATASTLRPRRHRRSGGRAVPMQVIWAIGACMIVLAGCSGWGGARVSRSGCALVAHNLLDADLAGQSTCSTSSGRCGSPCIRRCRTPRGRSCSCFATRCSPGSV